MYRFCVKGGKVLAGLLALVLCFCVFSSCGFVGGKQFCWEVHDMNRPQPTIVTPGQKSGQPPSHAVVLFDGKDLSKWASCKDDGPAKWKVENGYFEVVKKMQYPYETRVRRLPPAYRVGHAGKGYRQQSAPRQ